ncbi:myo-inositol-1(or 4)-monophosphatase/histidinol-phosphatase [Abditibacterium utsteinense]|uniref:Myo-inositol-1(Or 4)-monophosphatase/histidinol-phosphatase n=1 Tax=Abditibacterium utsteinense TaxID=1960156 RepID=A0A2S8SQB2_9BACT|nr:inositol monophosphatase [Abditibacterium utsteinense]PQV62982.1 myo-inositol-1(or 4)-monophosphatase/histidinol-phosphatase [Abditibacterium utsteinense]
MSSFQLPFEAPEALEILREATQISLQMRSNAHAVTKADQTLVTEADHAIEAFLREKLSVLAPGWSFLGEEEGLSGDPTAPCWVIDPIDGTTNYAKDLPLWCISVGAVHNETPIFGMIAVPETGEVLWAAPGQGAWLIHKNQTRKLQLHDALPLQQEDLIASNTTVERVVDFSNVPCRLRNFGSLAYHLTALARGSLVATIAHYHKIYDVAAGICICCEAGANVRYLNGDVWHAKVKTSAETQPMLCAPPQILQFLIEALGPKEKSEAINPAQAISEND